MKRARSARTLCRTSTLVLLWVSVASGCERNASPDKSNAFQRQEPTDIRVMSWNVKRNSILPPNGVRHEKFARIVRALDPDVIALQEVVRPDLVEELTRLMNLYAPLDEGHTWHVHAVSDNAVMSRYPVKWRGGERLVPYPLPQFMLPDFHLGFASVLIDLPDGSGGTDLLVVAMHNKSGSSPDELRMRQNQSDAIVGWFRDLRDPARQPIVTDGTPVILLGDMNVYPDAPIAHYETLINGDIADEETFGPDFEIDWDGTDLADARPSHNSLGREYYTWRHDALPFEPSAMDRVLYTDSVMSVRQGFVLNTMTLSGDDLAILGLRDSDVIYGTTPNYYDHLPLFVDFSIVAAPRQ